jgi:hypothetical protein
LGRLGAAPPHVLPVLIEEQDRTKQAGKLGFHNPHQLLQYFLQRSIAGYHLQNTALSVTQRLCPLAPGGVHHCANELDATPFVAEGMIHNTDIFDGTIRHHQATFVLKILPILCG